MWGGPVRNLAAQLGVELDDVRQRIEPWYTDERIECKMCTVEDCVASRAKCQSRE